MFVDEVDIRVAAGHGGRGCLSFRREKFVERGGPDGGDGGDGGSVYLTASPHLNTLVRYRFHPEHQAGRGAHGQGARKTGKRGKHLRLEVPVGTVILERTEDGTLLELGDLTNEGDRLLVARGGRGGRGNARFTSSTNRAPRRTEPGESGDEKRLHLRLKLLADVGLVGFPNVGKSTLIARVSAARPKIGDYPFTTLTPNLGVVSLDDERSFVVADVPGLIEGAHTGHGLGDRFLGHVERTTVLVHVVDVSEASGRDPVDDLDIIRRELESYAPGPATHEPAVHLGAKRQLVAANKIDVLMDRDRLARLARASRQLELPLYEISAVTGAGMPALLEALWAELRTPASAGADAVAAEPDEAMTEPSTEP